MAHNEKNQNDPGSAHSAPMVSNVIRNWRQNLTDKNLPNLLNEMKGAIGQFEGGVFVGLYVLLAAVAAVAQHFEDDVAAWAKFCRHEFWDDIPKKGHPSKDDTDTLPSVMRFSMGSDDAARKSATRYVQAIRPLLDAGVTPESLVDEIKKAGGIMKLVAGIRAERRKQRSPDEELSQEAADDKKGGRGLVEKDRGKGSPVSGAVIDKPDSATGPVAKPEDDENDDDSDYDLGLAVDKALDEIAAKLMMRLSLDKATRSNWRSTKPFPRKLYMEVDLTDVDDGVVEAELVDWRDDEPWPGGK